MNRNLIVTLDAQRNNLVHQLSKLPKNAVNDRDALLNYLHHMVHAEEQIIGTVVTNVGAPTELEPLGFWADIKANWNIGKAIPLEPLPKMDSLDIVAICESWAEIRLRLDEVDLLEDEVLEKAIYKHPKVGKCNYEHVLKLLHKNFEWHLAKMQIPAA